MRGVVRRAGVCALVALGCIGVAAPAAPALTKIRLGMPGEPGPDEPGSGIPTPPGDGLPGLPKDGGGPAGGGVPGLPPGGTGAGDGNGGPPTGSDHNPVTVGDHNGNPQPGSGQADDGGGGGGYGSLEECMEAVAGKLPILTARAFCARYPEKPAQDQPKSGAGSDADPLGLGEFYDRQSGGDSTSLGGAARSGSANAGNLPGVFSDRRFSPGSGASGGKAIAGVTNEFVEANKPYECAKPPPVSGRAESAGCTVAIGAHEHSNAAGQPMLDIRLSDGRYTRWTSTRPRCRRTPASS